MNILWAPVAALGVYYVLLSLERALRRRLLLTQTCVLDIDSLGHRLPRQKIKGTAVICGGSIAGLTAARVCYDHFEDVVIIEPEAWLNSADAKRPDSWNQENRRSRIMQYESFHALLTIGYTAMRKLFPNFVEECKSSAIRTGPNDTHVHLWGHNPKKPYNEYGGMLPKTIYTGRIGLETLLRRLVLGSNYKNIRQVTGTATGVSQNTSNPRFIERVSIRTAKGNIVDIQAALVINCTGSTTAGLKWLQREGYGFADTYAKNQLPLDGLKIAYDQKLRYSTLQFRVPPELGRKLPGLPVPYDECGIIYCLIADPEKENRGVYSQRIEGEFMQLCFSISGGDGIELPKTLEEAKVWSRSLITEVPIPEGWFAMLDMLKEVQDSMTCSQVRFAPSTWIQYEKGVNLPSNWIAAGDSVMRVNPLHGQGCSKAMYGAICINQLLQTVQSSIPKDFSQRYFRMHAAKIEPLWNTAKVADYAFASTVPVPGETLSEGSWLRWYMKKLMILSFTVFPLLSMACTSFDPFDRMPKLARQYGTFECSSRRRLICCNRASCLRFCGTQSDTHESELSSLMSTGRISKFFSGKSSSVFNVYQIYTFFPYSGSSTHEFQATTSLVPVWFLSIIDDIAINLSSGLEGRVVE